MAFIPFRIHQTKHSPNGFFDAENLFWVSRIEPLFGSIRDFTICGFKSLSELPTIQIWNYLAHGIAQQALQSSRQTCIPMLKGYFQERPLASRPIGIYAPERRESSVVDVV